MSARPVGGNTIHRDLGMFKAALNWACQKYEGGQPLLTRHAMEKYKIPTEKDPKRPVADEGTIRALLAVAPWAHPFFRLLVLLGGGAGRRLSSILALHWGEGGLQDNTNPWRAERD